MSRRTILTVDLVASALPAILCYYQAPSLVADPITTILQHTLYVLPLTLAPLALQHGLSTTLAPTAMAMSLGTGLLYTLAVLLGAPVMWLVQETLSLCLFCSLVGILPLLVHRSTPPTSKSAAKNRSKSSDEPWMLYDLLFKDNPAVGKLVGTLVGAYVGCVPIPLDWDRPWQRWPVTVYMGACAGLFVGTIAQVLYDKGRASLPANATDVNGPRRITRKVEI